MPRPRKHPRDRRDRKVVVWMTATEQTRFLVNAARVGLTAPDYVRALSCGTSLQPIDDADDPGVLVLRPTRSELATVLANAGAAGEAVDRYVVSRAVAGATPPPASTFELVDALVRNGTALQRLIDIAAATGVVPDDVRAVAGKIERLLDELLR